MSDKPYRPFGSPWTSVSLPVVSVVKPPQEPQSTPKTEIAEEPHRPPALPRRRGAPREVGPKATKSGAKAVDLLVMSGVDRDFAAGLISWLLQETCGKAPKKEPVAQPDEADSDFDILMRRYRRLHKDVTTIEPDLGKVDIVVAHQLLRKHGLALVERQLDALAAYDDQFIRQQGFTFSVLQRHWSRIATSGRTAQKLARRDAPAGCKHQPPCQTAEEHSRRYLDDQKASPSRGRMSLTRTT